MLQNRLRLVLFNRFGHHVKDVVHNRCTKLEIAVGFDALLCDGLRDTLAVTAFKLTCKQVPEPVTVTSGW